MANVETPTQPSALHIGSHQTAICIIPPAYIQSQIDALRELYDKAHGKWPPHINLIYPFVAIENLPRAMDIVLSNLSKLSPDSGYRRINVRLEVSDYFPHRNSSTVFLASNSKENGKSVDTLRSIILEGFKCIVDGHEYRPHLTIGQAPSSAPSMREYLLDKAKLLLPIEWQVEELVVLVRERVYENSKTESWMKVWGSISLFRGAVINAESSLSIRRQLRMDGKEMDNQGKGDGQLISPHVPTQYLHSYKARKPLSVRPGITYFFSPKTAAWKPLSSSPPLPSSKQTPSNLRISTYNVLHDPSIALSAEERYPIVLQSIISGSALSDVLILQEVSDEFLSYLLGNYSIRSHYSFATNAPMSPLSSVRNIVVLSRWNFTWQYLSFEQRHKGAVIVQFANVRISKNLNQRPLVVAGVHLSSGLSNSAVAARKSQLDALLGHLLEEYPTNPWIVAGDFNIATSRAATEEAVEMKLISAETASMSDGLVLMLEEEGLVDAWVSAGNKGEDDAYDGDEGATFDPTKNPLAAETVSNTGSNNMRPRRYDRIFVKGDDVLDVVEFNMFGQQDGSDYETADWKGKDRDVVLRCGSDHYGIRATMGINPLSFTPTDNSRQFEARLPSVRFQVAPLTLTDLSALHSCLTKNSAVPSEAQIRQRKEVFALLGTIFQCPTSRYEMFPTTSSFPSTTTAQPAIILQPVGSYALETSLPTADLDILAIGSLRGPAFFSLAMRRLQSFEKSGVKVLRKVDAATGTMLELEVRGVKCDLQYCCAPNVVSKWSEISSFEPVDPTIFQLPIQALQKLNSYRDIEHVKHAIPQFQMQDFKLAHRFLHVWARERGVYAGKFGFLNGFAITLMLFQIVKCLPPSHDASAADLICSFFVYYSSFDWKEDMVIDSDFSVDKKKYRRSPREVIVVLSLHAPRVNVMRNASLPALETISEELQRADQLLAEPSVSWESLIGADVAENGGGGAREFLRSYRSYVKIEANYWGPALSKGGSLVGWLESKFVALLVDIGRKLPGIQARIWPARFVLRDYISKKGIEDELRGCYLIGLKKAKTLNERPSSDSEHKFAQNALQTVLENFADQIRGNDKYFDPSSSWVDVKHVKQSDLGELVLDKQDWGALAGEDYAPDAERHGREEEADIDVAFSDEANDENAEFSIARLKHKTNPASKGAKSSTEPVSSKKLRPASDILSRLRWDPELDSSDYLVGYIDRFLGTKEQGLEKWKSEQTDEEFIPQHRIVYFKRRSDGVRVWDRDTRLDLVFGSGAGAG